MRITRRLAGLTLHFGAWALAFAGFMVFGFAGGIIVLLFALALMALAEAVLPPAPTPTVIVLGDDPEPPPVVVYDVRSRITPKRLWSDG